MLYRITVKDTHKEDRLVVEVRFTQMGIVASTHEEYPFIGSLFKSREAAILALGHVVKQFSPFVKDFRVERYERSLALLIRDQYEIEAIKYFENLSKIL